APKAHSDRREGGAAVAKATSSPAKRPSLPPLPIKSAILEPALAGSLEDEVLRRQKAEAEAAALQGQLGQAREGSRELGQQLEAAAAEVGPGDAHSVCAFLSMISELEAQLSHERWKRHALEARLLEATLHRTSVPTPRMSPRVDLSELIGKDREICTLQEQLAQEISRSAALQSRLAVCGPSPRRASFDLASPRQGTATTPRWQTPTPSPRRASFDLASPRQGTATTPRWQTPTRVQSPHHRPRSPRRPLRSPRRRPAPRRPASGSSRCRRAEGGRGECRAALRPPCSQGRARRRDPDTLARAQYGWTSYPRKAWLRSFPQDASARGAPCMQRRWARALPGASALVSVGAMIVRIVRGKLVHRLATCCSFF
ncbi:unnamed protein product, partial [Prorocentrum cordatum]